MTDEHHADRRSFLKTGTIAGTALVAGASGAIAQQVANTGNSNAPLTKGDIDILRFLAVAEILESDLWDNTTNSEESRIAKSPPAAGTRNTPRR